jgi:aspartokinase-like uncharacterized kinase
MQKSRAWIIKVGGSLAGTPRLEQWLAAAAAARWNCVLVPGGGTFSRAVAGAQREWGASDRAAHRMAIMGMTQYGIWIASRHGLAEGTSCRQLRRAAARGPVVWLPTLGDITQMDRDGIPSDWTVTADSLALWLAHRLGIPKLLLLKSGSAEALRGMGDAAGYLPETVATFGPIVRVKGQGGGSAPLELQSGLTSLAAQGIVDTGMPALALKRRAPEIFVQVLAHDDASNAPGA